MCGLNEKEKSNNTLVEMSSKKLLVVAVQRKPQGTYGIRIGTLRDHHQKYFNPIKTVMIPPVLQIEYEKASVRTNSPSGTETSRIASSNPEANK